VLKDKFYISISALIARGASLASSSATWVAIPELYPTAYRTTGHSIANIMARIGAFISPYIVASSLSHEQVAMLLGTLSMLACLAVCMLPETAGIDLEHAGLDLYDDDDDDRIMGKAAPMSDEPKKQKQQVIVNHDVYRAVNHHHGTSIELSPITITSKTKEEDGDSYRTVV
jgi:hypothetical protein